jgi:thiol-disulfide isomerase/thioredoxin
MRSLRTLLPIVAIVGLILAALIFSGGARSPGAAGGEEPAGGPSAPDFSGGTAWLNSPPLTIAGLRGKAVLVDFWTYSCINCQRTLPYLKQWWQKYRDQGLVIVGVHTPEFGFEKERANVEQALGTYGVSWPVVMDNDYAIWNAYQNRYWPHKFLIDRAGRVVYDHIGEGGYIETEQQIAAALGLDAAKVSGDEPPVPISETQTPELYAGYQHGTLGNSEQVRPDRANLFRDPHEYPADQIVLTGGWVVRDEYIQRAAEDSPGSAKVVLRYRAKNAYTVMGNAGAAPLRVYVTLDGKPLGQGNQGQDIKIDEQGQSYADVSRQDLYRLVATPSFEEHVIAIWSDSPDFRFYTFTFGS